LDKLKGFDDYGMNEESNKIAVKVVNSAVIKDADVNMSLCSISELPKFIKNLSKKGRFFDIEYLVELYGFNLREMGLVAINRLSKHVRVVKYSPDDIPV